MAPDSFKNLGFGDDEQIVGASSQATPTATAAASQQQQTQPKAKPQ